jgi:ferredoxin
MRLHIDCTRCDGRGLCTELLPELLGRDQWGYPIPLDGSREPEIIRELRGHADQAIVQCPLVALTLVT